MSVPKVIPFPAESGESTAALRRYKIAYQATETAINFAETVKLTSIFVGGLLVVAALMAFQTDPAERSGFPVFSASLLAGAVLVVLVGQLWSAAIRVLGQLMATTNDLAVNSSPFLSDGQRAAVMSLKQSPHADGEKPAA
jgi:hypothetical protein